MTGKKAQDLVAGDKTEWYTVEKVHFTSDGEVVAIVRYNDGGTGKRVWENPETVITLKE